MLEIPPQNGLKWKFDIGNWLSLSDSRKHKEIRRSMGHYRRCRRTMRPALLPRHAACDT